MLALPAPRIRSVVPHGVPTRCCQQCSGSGHRPLMLQSSRTQLRTMPFALQPWPEQLPELMPDVPLVALATDWFAHELITCTAGLCKPTGCRCVRQLPCEVGQDVIWHGEEGQDHGRRTRDQSCAHDAEPADMSSLSTRVLRTTQSNRDGQATTQPTLSSAGLLLNSL